MKKQEYFKYLSILLLSIGLSYVIYSIRKSKAEPELTKTQAPTPLLQADGIKNLLPAPLLLPSSLSLKEIKKGGNVDIQIKNNLKKNHIFILLTKGDCYDCYKDVSFWNRLQNISDSLKVFAVIKGEHEKYMQDFITSNGIHIPVLVDKNNTLFPVLEKIPNSYTPISLFINREGILLSATHSNYGDIIGQGKFVQFLNQKL